MDVTDVDSSNIPVLKSPYFSEVRLEKVLGLTVSSNASFDCDPSTSVVAYPAGCVLVLYNVRKNKQNHIISSSRKTITSLAFSSDGKYLATGECGHQPHVRVWDAHEKVQIGEFSGHKFGINCVAFSPNLKYVVSIGSQHDMIVNVWDWKNNVKVASNKVSCKVKAVSFASGGNYFVTVGNRHVKFWYLEYSRTTKYKLEPVPLMGRSAILGDLRNNYFCDVACGKNNMADSTYAITKSGLLCEFNSRRLLDKWVELRTTSANSLCVGQEFIFIGCADGLVRCFSPFNLNFICTLPRPHFLGVDIAKGLTGSHAGSHPKGAKYPDTIAVTFDETSKKVTCVYNDHSMYTWDIKDVKKVGKSHSFLYHSACIWGVETYPTPPDGLQSVLPPGTFLTCSSDDTIRVWNLESNMSQNTAYHRNIYSTETLKILYMDSELSYLCDVDVNASGSNDKVDTTYDGKNGVRCLKISPEGRHLAAGDRSGNIRICDLEFMDELCKIEAHDSEVLCLEYSKDNNSKQFLASASRDRLIHIFNVNQDYSFQQTLDDHSSSITAVRFVQQGPKLQMISCGADKSIIFRKAQFTPHLNLLREHHVVGKTTLYDMEVDPQQEHVLTACQDRNIRIYNCQTGKSVRSFRGSQGDDGTLIKVVLDTNGSLVATSCTDKTLYVYDYSTGECMASMSGHSELVTGLKFTNNGKHLISVSGDGCIFVWKLPSEFSHVNENRHSQSENTLPTIWQDGGRSVGVTKPMQAVVESDKSNKNNAKSPEGEETNGPAYRFSVGQLPLWAKKQMFEDLSQSKSEKASAPVPPRGRWAQRIEGQGLVVKSYLETDSVIPFPNNNQNQKDSGGLKEFQKVRESILQSYQNKSEQNVSDDSSKESGKHGSPSKVTVRPGLDRAKSPPEIKRIRHPTDSSSAGSLKLEDVDAEDECSENENTLYFPPSDDESDHGDGASYKVCATNEDEMRATRKKIRRSRPDRLREFSSLSTPDSGELNSEDEDASTPVESEPSFLGNFSVSTENLERLGQREKFMKSNYESLEMGGKGGMDGMHYSRASISAKFLAKSSHGFLTRHDSGSSGSEKKSQINIAHSKKREELTKALNEAKKKLETVREQNLGFKGGLSSSKSIGDLHSLPDKDISYIHKESTPNDIRRTSSLSDLSFGGPRRILQPSPAPQDTNVSAPLWKQATPVTTPVRKSSLSGSRHQPAVSVVAPSPSGRNSLPRSISMGSLRGDPNHTPQKVPSMHTLGRVSASPRRSSAITPLTKAASSSTMNYLGRNSESPSHRYSIANIDIQRLHSDDSSSDTSPTEPHKPLPLSKSFTFSQSKSPDPNSLTQPHYPRRPNTLMVGRREWKNDPSRSKSEKDLRGVGRDSTSNDLRVQTLSRNMPLPDLWNKEISNGSSYIGPRIDLPDNPSQAELTQELCDSVADELKRVTSYAMQIFQRVTLSAELRPSEKSYMTTALAQGVLQAQQTLRPAVPPMYPSGGSENFVNSKRPSVSDILPSSGAKGDPNTIALLQQYSDRLFNLIEQRFTKTQDGSKQQQSD